MRRSSSGLKPNFHEAKRVGLNAFSELAKVPEGAEYKYVTTSDSDVPVTLTTYCNIFSITRQAIMNGDLRQLSTIPQVMGRAATRTVGNLVYLQLTSSPLFPLDQSGTLNQNPCIINVVKDMAQVVVEPRLDKAKNKEWYVTAAQGTDTIRWLIWMEWTCHIWSSRRASPWTVLHGRCVLMLAWRRGIIGA